MLFLVSSKVDAQAKDMGGRTAAELAQAAGHLVLAKALTVSRPANSEKKSQSTVT